eukprot:TCONS_00017082-protein
MVKRGSKKKQSSSSGTEEVFEPQSSFTLEIFSNEITKLKEELTSHLTTQLTEAKDDIIKQLKNENQMLRSELQSTQKRVVNLETELNNLQQYNRRNNIEFCGIPKDDEEDLESKVIGIADTIGIKIKRQDIEACHRLKKNRKEKTPRTIVRFVNRKFCDLLHQRKKNLSQIETKGKLSQLGINDKLFINCNLAPYSRFLWSQCKKLYDGKLID